MINYNCSIEEWLRLNIYTTSSMGFKSKAIFINSAKDIYNFSVICLIMIALTIFFNIFYTIPFIIIILTIRFFYSKVFYYIVSRKTKKLSQTIRQNQKDITYIVLDSRGIGVNIYNSLEDKLLLWINWEEVNDIELIPFIYSTYYKSGKNSRLIECYFKRVKKRYNLDYDPQFYNKLYTLKFSYSKSEEYQEPYSYIQIPPKWIADNTLSELLDNVCLFAGKKISIEGIKND